LLSVAVSFRSILGQSSSTMVWASLSPSKQTNTLEQKDAKKVDHARITTAGLSDSPSQAVGRLRYCYQMDMIGHQAIRQDLDLESVAPLCHELDVAPVIFVTGNRLLSAVSALRDVMSRARCDNTC
jgi:hypothetical protein